MSLLVIELSEILPTMPFEQPVVVLAIALAAFLMAPVLIEQVGLPGIVGIVLAGTLLGPNALEILDHSEAIILLGNAGLVYLLFTVGVALDLRRFFNAPEDAALFGLVSFTVPFVIGIFVIIGLLGMDFWPAVLLASVFATHTLLAYPVVNKLDITTNSAITSVFGGILFTDTLGLIVLALVLGAVEGGLTALLVVEIAVALGILFAGLWIVIPPVARWFFKSSGQESYFEFLFVAMVIFAAASLAEGLGLAGILGAFVAGLALNRQIARGGTLMNRIEFFGNAFFIPFFLFHVGMLVDPGILIESLETLWITAVILGVLFPAKLLAAGGVSWIQGYNSHERGVLFGMSVGQAAAALAITLLGFEAGLFSAEVLNAVVLMILVTAIASPWITERYGLRLATQEEAMTGPSEPYDPRILLPLSRTAELQQRLLELSYMVKESPASTPVHLLTVLSPTATNEELVAAESDLRDAAAASSAAEVPAEVETRVNHSVASGIVSASVETRTDLIVMGWEEDKPLGGRIFGDIIDQVRTRTTDPILVSRLGRPINTISRILLILPPDVGHHDGFAESLFLVNRIGANLGIPIEAIAVGNRPPPARYEAMMETVDPDTQIEITSVSDWSELDERLEAATESDLIVPIMVREGTIGWAPQLRRLPQEISKIPPEAFVVVIPRQGDPGYAARFLRMD